MFAVVAGDIRDRAYYERGMDPELRGVFYLFLPLVIAGLRLRNRSSSERILVLVAFAVFLFVLNIAYNFHLHMVMFISGMLVFELTQLDLKLRWLRASWLLPATLVLMLATRYGFYHTYEWPVALIMFFGYGLICYDVFRGTSRLAGFFALPMMRWYGNMSYSYYLIHGLTLKFLFLALGLLFLPNKTDEWVFYALFVPFFLVTLCVSAVLFVAVEKPLSFARRVEAPRVSVRFD
jgi:exopolysaccharide production protein ExoZ